MSDQVWNYLLISAAALAGVLARMGEWREPDGTVDWRKALGECMSVPAITFIVVGIIAYFAPDLDQRIAAALSALLGVVGTAGIQSLALQFFKKKIG